MNREERFTAVYQRSYSPMRAFLARRVQREVLDDLTADVFAVAWRKLDSVREGEELPWLYRIASYVVANHRRKNQRDASLLQRVFSPDSAPSAAEAVESDAELAQSWARLQPSEREVIALVIVDGLSVQEAAQTLGITPNALSIRLHRAKKHLARLLDSGSPSHTGKISPSGDID